VSTFVDLDRLTWGAAAMDPALEHRWWTDRRAAAAAIGYRRRCEMCDAMKFPEVNVSMRWFRRSRLYQTCATCRFEWPGRALTSSFWVDGQSIHLRLRGDSWWVYDQVTLEALRECPDVRGAADLIWSRMEREGLLTEARGARR
jgi:hypothetical protein